MYLDIDMVVIWHFLVLFGACWLAAFDVYIEGLVLLISAKETHREMS